MKGSGVSRAVVVLLGTCWIHAALAQTVAPKADHPQADDKGGNAALKAQPPTQTDINFVKEIAKGGMAEVSNGELASQKAADKRVKDFGRMMASDHGKANAQLAELARAKAIELPATLNPDQQQHKAMLEQEQAARFDNAYLGEQLTAHQQAVLLLQHEINSGQDVEIRQWAMDTLPVVNHHLEIVTSLTNRGT
jgi:putative membrane protein